MDITYEFLKFGPAGLVCIILYIGLVKSEQREAKKDLRIQLLENQLIESYDERIASAEAVSNAMYENARAMEKLTYEVKEARK